MKRVGSIVVAALLGAGCSSQSHPPSLVDPFDSGVARTFDAGNDDAGFAIDTSAPPLDCAAGLDAGLCACTEIGQSPPTLYLVLDKSGSMANPIPPSTSSKWNVIREALLGVDDGVLRKLGARVALGTMIFPSDQSCGAGEEVLGIRVGSPSTYDTLAKILGAIVPVGGTPTAVSLEGVIPRIAGLKGPIYVLLATDGGPNCGKETACSPNQCSYVIDGDVLPPPDNRKCSLSVNCCDPAVTNGVGLGWGACVDAAATQQSVIDLSNLGVKTFVLGVPGAAPYADDLNALAVAGGTAQDPSTSPTQYYDAEDTDALTKALSAIAAKVVDTCSITLADAPADPGVTNVLLDGTVIPQDGTNGWTWADPTHVQINGSYCDRIEAGDVASVQVAVGCKTVTR